MTKESKIPNVKIPSAEKSTSNPYLYSVRAWEFVLPSSLDIRDWPLVNRRHDSNRLYPSRVHFLVPKLRLDQLPFAKLCLARAVPEAVATSQSEIPNPKSYIRPTLVLTAPNCNNYRNSPPDPTSTRSVP